MNQCPADRIPIILGANLIPEGQSAPPGAILFNLEQIVDGAMWLTPSYVELLRRNKVWDYSEQNLAALAKLGVHDVTVVPLGFVPELHRIPKREKMFDVLFYGSGNKRREKILQDLHFRGAVVKSVFDVYGVERDVLIARSRAIINIHFYESRILEVVRIGYLLANEAFVVSEASADGVAEREFEGGLAVAPYESLVDTCMEYLRDEPKRLAVARRGFELFSARDQAAALRAAIQKL